MRGLLIVLAVGALAAAVLLILLVRLLLKVIRGGV